MERRICAVFLPTLSIDLLKMEIQRESRDSAALVNKPLVLVKETRGKQLIIRRCDRAKGRGISVGMNLADAQSHAADLLHFPFRDETEKRVLNQLSLWGYRFSPIVSVDQPPSKEPLAQHDPRYNGLLFDLTGCEKLFHGEDNLMQQILSGLRHFHLNCQLAIAPTVGSAWALSRYSTTQRCLDRKSIRDTVSHLPISALRLSRGTLTALMELNIRSIENLLVVAGGRPRHTLLNRFGKEPLQRIDQLLGIESESIAPVEQKQIFRTWHNFNSPINDREVLKRAFNYLLEDLVKQLSLAQKRSWKFCLWLKGVNLPPTTRYITLNLPSLKLKHLTKLIALNLENISLPAPIEEIRLFSECDEAFQPEAISFLPGDDSAREIRASFAQLLDKFRTNLGQEQVCEMQVHASHIPERSHTFRSITNSLSSLQSKAPVVPPVDRPSILFSTPERIRALAVVPDSPPFSLRWREQSYRIAQGIGPERIQSEWWNSADKEPFSRDYFKVQLELGTWFWVFRTLETSEWYLHGIWA